MHTTIRRIGISIALGLLNSLPLVTLAGLGPGAGTAAGTGSGGSGLGKAADLLLTRACKLISYMYTGIIILSVGCFIYAAWLFISGGASEKNVTSARSAALWAIVGLVIALVAMGVPAVIGNFLGVDVSATPCS